VGLEPAKFEIVLIVESLLWHRENLAAIFGPITRRIIELVGKQIQGTKSRKGRGPKVGIPLFLLEHH
jgi:hypothetical protein